MGGIAGDVITGGTLGLVDGDDLIGGLTGETAANAAMSASQAQLQGIRESNQLQRDMFNAQTGLNSFQRGIGNQSLNLLAGMYGIQGGYDPAGSVKFDENGKLIDVAGTNAPGAGAYGTGAPNYNAFLNSPDYLWALQQGQQGLDRSAAAGGSLFSGGRLKEAAQYNQGMATQQLGNFQNRLASLAGIGTTANNNVSSALNSAGNNISQGLMGMGDARASGYTNAANARQAGYNQLFSLAGNIGSAAMFACDRRLKKNIERIGTHPSGVPWYRFDYLWGDSAEGPMADEVAQIRPEAVVEGPSGMLFVNMAAL